jgi:hypothetical protein
MGVMRNSYKNLIAECDEKPLIRPSRRWKSNIKIDLKETGYGLYFSGQGK